MIKLIEEDGDSFARKAEMYYKKRPELMKLVEELYRAYRALAERYDHAGCDDSAPNSPYGPDSLTPDSRTFDPVDLKDGSPGTVRKVLNFSDSEYGGHINGPRDRKLSQLENEPESESQKFKETLEILEAKMEESLELYKRAREKIQENENVTKNLNREIERLEHERDSAYDQYKKSMEMKSDVEKKLVELEKEIEILRLEIIKLNKEKEQQTLLHQQYLDETEKLKTDIGNAISLFKKAEKERLTLEKSNEDLEMKIGKQNQEIAEEQKELGRLWACIHEERLRFVEAETAFQTLQQLHSQSQSQEELQNRARILEKIEKRNKKLKNEINKQIEENKNLEQEVDQRNALQQEIYCLKDELNGLKSTHGSILEELSNVGLNPENLGSSVKVLQDENFKLKENFLTEKSGLHAKLEVMGQLLEKNLILENSLSDLGTEKSNLAVENGNLSGQLRVTTDNLTQIMKKNTLLENSLFDTHVKLEVLKQKSKSFKDSCQVLADEKSALLTEKGTLLSQIEFTETTLKNLEGKYSLLEKERESTLCKVEELNLSLALQNQEHVILRNQIQLLQEQGHKKDKEFENGLDKSFDSEIEIFVLLKCVQDLEEKNVYLFNDFKKLLEAYDLLENLVNVLKQEKNENQIKIKSLFAQNDNLKIGFEGNKCALIENEDKNMKLVVEISILVAFIKQLKVEMAVIEAENCGLENGARELSKVNEGLRSKVCEGDFNEQMLKIQLENLNSEFLIVQEGYRALQMENSTVLEEKMYLLEDNIQKDKKLEDAITENLDLKKDLEKSELELKTVISVSDRLNSELLNGNNLLKLKEYEHEEVVQQLMNLENDKKELSEIITDLERENNEGKTVNDEQKKQIVKLLEDNYLLEVKLHELTENQEKTEETGRLLEEQGMLVFGDLVASNICQIVLEETIQNAFLDLNNELIKEKSNILESENGEIKARLAAYGPVLGSLRDSIVSLENHTRVGTKVPQSENEDAKADESVTMNHDPLIELQDLQSKVKVIEIGVLEMQQEKLEIDAKLESLTKQNEELILINQKNYSKPISRSEISEADPKDIMLDQASECSSYAVSKRGLIEGEIWETVDDSKPISKHHPTASDVSFIVDKLEASRRFKEHREENGNKRKILDRLNSDVLKLTNLQITIEDLKRKVEITSRSRRGKSMIECETLKGQLMESESTIQNLYELNGKLVKHIDGIGDSGKSRESELGESEIMRRKKVSEQAIRVSEKIGRLQLEIQKIQFVLLKLDDENENSKRVLLKDYLYGGRTKTAVSSRRKKGHFCACVEPSTKGD